MDKYIIPYYTKQYFPAPETFHIDRYAEPRNEHKPAGVNAYVPFGVGTHVCDGGHRTELQMTTNILLSARHLELELVPKNDKLKLSSLPKGSVSV